MFAGKNRVRLALQQMEDRCTPAALLGNPFTDLPPAPVGPQVAQIGKQSDRLDAAVAAPVRVNHAQVVPIKLAYQCSGDISTMTASAQGYASFLGNWTAEGRFNSVQVDRARDRATNSG